MSNSNKKSWKDSNGRAFTCIILNFNLKSNYENVNNMVYGGGEAFAAAQIKGKLIEFYDRSWQLQLICIFGGSGR